MNVQDYISSGIVESCVLGLASAEERSEFERMCAQYPEVSAARTAFEMVLEKQAMENAVAPEPGLKERIMSGIRTAPAIPAREPAPVRAINWWKYAVAACLVVLAGSIYFNLTLSKKNRNLEGQFQRSVAQLDSLQDDMRRMTDNPQMKMASMRGTEVSPVSYATVFWDTTSHDVYLLANNLPAPASGMQYQLWALFDNKPIDLGMLDYDLKQKRLLVRMKNAQNAQAFAITLEKKDRPDPSRPEGKMVVMGSL